MIQYIHTKKKKWKKSSLIITTPLLKMYTQREQCGGGKKGGHFIRPSTESIGEEQQQKNDDKKCLKSPKWWLRSFQAAANRPNSVPLRGRAVLPSLLSLVLSVCPPSPAHCLEPDRKPGRPGPESERRLFLLLCFLFRPAAILHAPGGPVLIRVPACSRAVPEVCVAIEVPRGKRRRGGEGGSHIEGG